MSLNLYLYPDTFIGCKFLISGKMEFEAHIKLETFVSLFEMQMLTTLVVGTLLTNFEWPIV